MFTKTLNCGNCGHLVDFPFQNITDFRRLTPEELQKIRIPNQQGHSLNDKLSFRHVHATDKVTAASWSQCPRCNYPTMIIFETTSDALNSLQIVDRRNDSVGLRIPILDVLKQYPPEQKPSADPLWPDSIRRNFSDAQKMHTQGISPSIVLTTCGTVLELALKELDPSQDRKNLYQRIECLHKSGVITSPIKDWAHDLRLDRNNAVHDGEGEAKDATEYIEFLKIFFNMAFSLPARIAQKRQET